MLGATVPAVGGLPEAFKNGAAWGCECVQIYLTLSRTWAAALFPRKKVSEFKKAWSASPVRLVVAHVPYLVNLASADPVVRKKSIARLEIEIAVAGTVGVPFLVLHPGSSGGRDREEGIRKIVRALNGLSGGLRGSGVKILLETAAGQGSSLGSSFGELAAILAKLKNPGGFGVCFDTAHVFEAGYDIRKPGQYAGVFGEFDRLVGLDRLLAFHVNDSKTGLGSRRDRHAAPGEGFIGLPFFRRLVNDKRFSPLPMLLELPSREDKTRAALSLLKSMRMRDVV